MCGIAGGEKSEKLLEALEHRGSSSRTFSGDLDIGHVLHTVVGRVEQPLEGEGVLAANCEIYNWEELADEHGFEARNDSELLLKIIDEKGIAALQELDGVYALAYFRDSELILARDILGVKPVWYSEEPFAFASERQALKKNEMKYRELHPRRILRYDTETGDISFEQRDFFEIDVDESMEIEEAAEDIKQHFLDAVEKRVPEDEEVALLFSGGVDSTMVAAALQELGVEFTCYTAGIQHGNVDPPRDREWAGKVAEDMDLEIESYDASLEEVEDVLPRIADWISSTSAVKLGVALPFHFALQGDEKVVMSGLGSEQLYAGYDRHQKYLNRECLSGLLSLFQRDLYRDDVVSMRNGYELRLPFLDHSVVEHALTIPAEFKQSEEYRKYVLRKAAEKLGVPKQVAWRGKRAAQYGSNFDKAISRLAKDSEFNSKQKYLNSLRDEPNNKVAALTSGGKDSNAALYRVARRNNSVECLVTLESENDGSYMFDTDTGLVEEQADELGIPLIKQSTEGEKEDELEDLEAALRKAWGRFDIEGVVAGAIASSYQRDRVEKVAEKVGLKVFSPLWGQDQASYMQWLVREGFEVKIADVAARGLDESWVGEVLDEESVEELLELSEEYGFNAAGEGGEYETEVTGFPRSV
ncbi:MAG: diphthine--ammonia ligase [Candidatus Nanohaloarchaea archaeon]